MYKSLRYIMFLILSTNAVFCSEQIRERGTKCKYSCGNFIKLLDENTTSIAIDKEDVKGIFTFIKEEVTIYIMAREKYWQVIEKHFGPKTKSLGLKSMHPNVNEAKQWVENGKCKIGRVCAPNSDCWGSGSDYCYSDETYDWVKEKSFEYKGMWWTTSFRETCTLDWSCKIIKKKSQIHYNSEGEMFIVLDDDKIKIKPGETDVLLERKTYNVYIPSTPKENSITIHMKCFKNKNSLLCEGANEEMVKFEQGTRCTVLGPTKYCLIEGEFNRVRDFGANLYASISDLNQVRDAFVVNQERDNYNNYVISLKIRKIQRTLIKILESISEKNPQALNGILNGNYFSRPLTNGVFEVCSCENILSCDQREFHSGDVRFCGDKVHSKGLALFDVNKTIDYSIDDVFKFQGKEAHVLDTIMEEEEKGADFSYNTSGESFWNKIANSMNPFSWFSSVVGYIALGVAVLALLRK